jgi:rhodanese-related sulfurtransferase
MAAAMERFDLITTQELERMLAQRQRGEVDFVLVNSLDEIIYRHNAIPGSVNVPWSRVDELVGRLGTDKNKLIVTYWMGYRWVFAYKTAVAVKANGFTHIKIYNGGIKDWKKAGLPIETIDALPKMKTRLITAEELLALLQSAKDNHCRDASNRPLVTLLDLRTENHLPPEPGASTSITHIKTSCPRIFSLLDRLQQSEIRKKIPKTGLVVTVTETGNRDRFAIQYLSENGYGNIKGLMFGMRGWIKEDYPIETASPQMKP